MANFGLRKLALSSIVGLSWGARDESRVPIAFVAVAMVLGSGQTLPLGLAPVRSIASQQQHLPLGLVGPVRRANWRITGSPLHVQCYQPSDGRAALMHVTCHSRSRPLQTTRQAPRQSPCLQIALDRSQSEQRWRHRDEQHISDWNTGCAPAQIPVHRAVQHWTNFHLARRDAARTSFCVFRPCVIPTRAHIPVSYFLPQCSLFLPDSLSTCYSACQHRKRRENRYYAKINIMGPRMLHFMSCPYFSYTYLSLKCTTPIPNRHPAVAPTLTLHNHSTHRHQPHQSRHFQSDPHVQSCRITAGTRIPLHE